jgi:hypothetical protein
MFFIVVKKPTNHERHGASRRFSSPPKQTPILPQHHSRPEVKTAKQLANKIIPNPNKTGAHAPRLFTALNRQLRRKTVSDSVDSGRMNPS